MGQEIPRESLERLAKSSARWFYWIAGFSLVNSVILLGGSDVNFLVGLGVTMVVDVVARQIATETAIPAIGYAALGVSIMIAAAFALAGYLACNGWRVVYGVGLLLYVLDGALLAYLGVWPNVALHAFVAFALWAGLAAQGRLASMPPMALPAPPAPPPVTGA